MDNIAQLMKTDSYAFQDGISGFHAVLADLDTVLGDYPHLHAAVFEETDEWRRLLQHKLVPQLSASGCLIVAVAGGTNTGKSTLFNLLLRERKSAACCTAAATCAPVLVCAEERFQEAVGGELLPEFSALPLEAPEDATRYEMPGETLWVTTSPALPERLALLDTPDVDSIERRNWLVADHIRAAGDVVIAALTPEKYKDARVVDFFRQAHASGRQVVPVMNKANPNNDYAAARVQLAEFVRDAALDAPVCFAVPFDYALETELEYEIRALDDDISLLDYLCSLDVAAIKRSVYRDTLEFFLFESAIFLERAESIRERLSGVAPTYENRARAIASSYNPQPGEQMGLLLHEQIRAQRSIVVRGIARVNDFAYQRLQPVAGFLKRRLLGESGAHRLTEEERLALLREQQCQHIERIANDFASVLHENARDMEPVVGSLMQAGLEEADISNAVEHITNTMLGNKEVLSEEFKDHVARTIEAWWNGNPAQRRFLLELDAFMVFAPTAIAVPLAVFTAGVGAPEFMALASPLAGEFVARIMESRFAEQWVGLLQPWQQEQRDRLTGCIGEHLLKPALCAVNDAVAIFDWGYLDKLRRYWELCQTGFRES